MDVYSSEDDFNNDPHRCFLTITAPCGASHMMKQSLFPLLEWIDPALVTIRIQESASIHKTADVSFSEDKPETTVKNNSLCTPSLAVILFLTGKGNFGCQRMQKCFLDNRSWRRHHSIELSHKWSETLAGRQDFYSLFNHSPLWCINESYGKPEVLRFTIFVKNFTSMVEFYRIVTETEMESQKPGFCIFPLYQQPGLHIELCLKHHKRLRPYSVPTSYLTFKTRNIKALKDSLGVTVTEIKRHQYRVVDPDGNGIIVCDVASKYQTPTTSVDNANLSANTFDVTNDKSTCDNHDRDSGRFSDSDVCDSDVAASVEKLYRLEHVLNGRHCGDYIDCLVYQQEKDGRNTPTNCAISDKLCRSCRRDISHNCCLTTSDSTCVCNSNKDCVYSPEGYIDMVFKNKALSAIMKQSTQIRTMPTTCSEMAGNRCCSNVIKLEQRFENVTKSTSVCSTVNKAPTSGVAVNQHQSLQTVGPSELSTKNVKGEEVRSQMTSSSSSSSSSSRRNTRFQTPVFL
ncbi:uncharacterized protein LOC121381856 [Gigantopelta aegis]|uniref:uncharacterized protein LOC121381856 n=1 Tax=Gigantopelta aegis TaxID=1735272 RepID=UPI001B88CC12|nr:uncharacterized protein LOC121381856 [Gigantopelta aegis]